MKVAWLFIAIMAGAFLPVQAGLNARVGKAIASPLYASMISFITGAAAVLIYILITRQQVSWSGIKNVPPYAWLAGAMGAFYVTAMILAFPKLGPALTFGLVVGGQMIAALVLDHFNILVAQQHTINSWRILGIILVIAGVVIIRKF